ncbi:MAG: hypothetical protein IKZ25_00025 [Clostridia bacterium]|nr:hypothetical protein [Clostridia bacterium]
MRYTEIAIAKPFEGAPRINLADVFGASPKKPFLLKIPVTGQRPITYGAKNLPEGLILKDGIISGSVQVEGVYNVILTAKNALGETEKNLTLEIKENGVLLTPLMGFTSWNAFGSTVSQEKIENITKRMVELGICEYGYNYINIDSGWQENYGGKYDAIMPNAKFPDMKKLCDTIHSYGLKCGIYSTPMLTAWGCPKEFSSIPGCTVGEPDPIFAPMNGGIGKIRKEKNNVSQWTEWGFDYLKYDWHPCDPYNADLMKKELMASPRDFGFCVTITAVLGYINYWSQNCNSYRANTDSRGNWKNFLEIYNTYFDYMDYNNKGHYFDLDMLDLGDCDMFRQRGWTENADFGFTEDEQLVVFSARAFLSSPIQISSTLENLSEFELSMYCNEEILAIHQDSAFSTAKPYIMLEGNDKAVHVFRKKLSNGDYAIGAFNVGETRERVKIYLDEKSNIRDVWAKKDLSENDKISLSMPPHTVKIFRISAI